MSTNFALEELRKTLQQMESEELISRYRRGLFTEDALPVAREELNARNIAPPTLETETGLIDNHGLQTQVLDAFRGRLSLERAFWGGAALTFLPIVVFAALFNVELASASLLSLFLLGLYSTTLPCWLYCIFRCQGNTSSPLFSKVASHIAGVGALSIFFMIVSVFLR